ncbi:unnamed protein product [Linum tenue]|uniref:Uncharacterized protein n=1 Tax=Linum tenue TaxID=586396 RepID=A0AAV0J441_9ROSI|nr:unnamed protein product [Linum tenue]
MTTSSSDYLMRQFSRVNSAKQLPTTDWDFSQPTPLLDSDHDTEERKLVVLIEWISTILPDLKLQPKASVEELRECLSDGTVLLKILKKVRPGSFTEDVNLVTWIAVNNQASYGVTFSDHVGKFSALRIMQDGSLEGRKASPHQNVQRFLDNINERGIPKFEIADLEKGSLKRVVDCLLSLRVRYPTGRNNGFPTSGRMTRSGSLREFSPYQSLHLGPFSSSLSSPGAERQSLSSDSKLQQFLRTSPALSDSSAAWMHHAGHRFHEVFQVRQGRYADLSPSKISEMMKSTSLDNAPTQSLLSVVNGILDESIDRKNGEIPHRVACLLRKVVQEIERRISTQAEHLRTQNNLFKAREEKYQSRIRVLETLASGTGEDTGIVMDQLPPIKGVKLKVEEKTKVNDEIAKLLKEKEQASLELARLREELETTKTVYDDMVKLLKEKEHAYNQPSSSSQQENVNCETKNTQVSSLQQELVEGKKELNHLVHSMRDENQQIKYEQKTNAEILALQQELTVTKKELNDMVDSTKEKDQLKHEQKTNTEVIALQQELAATKKELNDVVTSVKEKDQRKLEVEATMKSNDEVGREASTAEITGRGIIVEQEVETRRDGNGDVVATLMKEKDQMSQEITTLKQELEKTRKGHDYDKARLMKEKEQISVQLTTLLQELEKSRQGQGDDVVRLVKEKDEMSFKISSLKEELETTRQEHDELGRLMKEKDQAGQDQLSTLQQELETIREAHKNAVKLEGELNSMRKARNEMASLLEEKGQANLKLAMSLQELEEANKAQEQKYLELEAETKTAAAGFDRRVKELETFLEDSRNELKGLKATLESRQQSWSKKETTFLKSVNFQFHALHEMRFSSSSIKEEVLQVQQDYSEKFHSLGVKFKALVDASENYYLVLAENRKLFNELQDLRGNIRVYCRVRPFLPGQAANKSVVEHISDKGELVVGNPAKTGKDGRKMFRFNRVYGPQATQAEVYLDTQPLVQSVLDGYNVCIFAYGQTGSGKTYTMLGPNGAQEEEWGVNYRALKDLFNMSKNRSDSISYEVGVQMVEIYNEQVRDLLTNDAQKKYPSFFFFLPCILHF